MRYSNSRLYSEDLDQRVEENITESITEIEEPLGIQYLKKGFSTPWEFSVLRTDVEDLHSTFKEVLGKEGKLPRIVVSFTSLPRRFDAYVRRMLEVLREQSYQPDHIYICVPKTSRRSSDVFEVPSWIKKDPHITVLRPEKDMGPATKLIPALRAEVKQNFTDTRVVTVDDDNEGGWMGDELLELLAYSMIYEDAAIGFTGWNVTCMLGSSRCHPDDSGVPMPQFGENALMFIKQSDDYACHTLADYKTEYYANCMGSVRKNYLAYADVLEGYRGVLYQPKFFKFEEIESLLNKDVPDFFFFVDDVWFSGWLATNRVSRLVVNPAIYSDSDVYLDMTEYARLRNLTSHLLNPSREDVLAAQKRKNESKEPEKGLHDLDNFKDSNLEGVRWFEKRNAWTKNLWKRPAGFLYNSEMNNTKD